MADQKLLTKILDWYYNATQG